MKKRFLFLLLVTFAIISCKNQHNDLPDGLYADIETNKGTITVALEFQKTPITVANFVSLAEGKNTFVNKDFKGEPFFNGLKWHRVEKGFVIQGGDPLGNGSGDTGYKFRDEIVPDLRFNKDGILAMANSGPGTGTNSSQFFITQSATPHLDGKHTIFGHVVGDGMKVVNNIEVNDDIVSIKIIRKGEAAKKFDAAKIFNDFFTHEAENQKKEAAQAAENKKINDSKYKAVEDQKAASFAALKKTATKSPSGLLYKIVGNGSGKKPTPGSTIYIHYSGFLESGKWFDGSVVSVAKEFGTYDPNREMQHGYMPIIFQAGKKDGMIPGFIEGIEKLNFGDKAVIFIPPNLGYGAQGAGNVIPPNANIIFEIQIFEKMPEEAL